MKNMVVLCGVLCAWLQAGADPLVRLENAQGAVTVDLMGANVVSFVPKGGREVLFRAGGETFTYLAGQWRNEGIPMSWPWFDVFCMKTQPMHGFARQLAWKIQTREDGERRSRLVLAAESSEATRRIWPHDFRLEYEIVFDGALSLSLTAINTGKGPFSSMGGFHPYFLISRLEAVRLEGLGAEHARVYPHVHQFVPAPNLRVELQDAEWGRTVEIAAENTTHAVLWNIGDSWSAFPDFREDNALRYICVEPQKWPAEAAVTVQPGARYSVSMKLSVKGNAAPKK